MADDTSLRAVLVELGAIGADTVVPYHPRVRDRADVAALRCQRSGVILLSRSDHLAASYYEKKSDPGQIQWHDSVLRPPTLADDARRAEKFGVTIAGRRWLDFGSGSGALLDLLASRAKTCAGLEPNHPLRQACEGRGLNMYEALEDLDDAEFDIITLFHVFEHLPRPVDTLRTLAKHLAPDGLILLEVPHARDFLLNTLDCAAFRSFTLWSEHLVLHTRDSLSILARAAGFPSVTVVGLQRYFLANHLYWLRHGKPGGHEIWSFLNHIRLNEEYEALLCRLDQTDTLIAYLRRESVGHDDGKDARAG